jgi:outer membrane protein TolC
MGGRPPAVSPSDEVINPASGGTYFEAATNLISLDECLQRALASHPRLSAARARAQAARFRIPQATALPDPMVETMFWPIAANAQQTAAGRMTSALDISQEIPLREKRATQGAIAAREFDMACAEVRQAEREIIESVRLAYYELWSAVRAIEIVNDNREAAAELVKAAEARYRAGGPQQDVIRAELAREELNLQLLELAGQKGMAQAELAALIQFEEASLLEPEAALPVADLPMDLEHLRAQAEAGNPELQNLAIQIRRDQQNERLACLQQYPDFKVGFQYGMMTTGGAISPVADGLDDISFSVGMTLPIWRKKIRAGICEAASQRASSVQLFEAEQLSIGGRLRRLIAETRALEQQRELLSEKVLPRTEQALQVATAEYAVGKSTFEQVIEIYSSLLTARLDLVRTDASLHGKHAEIQRLAGLE